MLFTMEMWELGVTVAPSAPAPLPAPGPAGQRRPGLQHRIPAPGRPSFRDGEPGGGGRRRGGGGGGVRLRLAGVEPDHLGDPLGGAAGKVAVQTVPWRWGHRWPTPSSPARRRGDSEDDSEGGGKGAPPRKRTMRHGTRARRRSRYPKRVAWGGGAAPHQENDSSGAAVKAVPGPGRDLTGRRGDHRRRRLHQRQHRPHGRGALLASGMTYWHELALIVLTLAVSYAIVFASGRSGRRRAPGGILQHPLRDGGGLHRVPGHQPGGAGAV